MGGWRRRGRGLVQLWQGRGGDNEKVSDVHLLLLSSASTNQRQLISLPCPSGFYRRKSLQLA